jgi:hypothetical protein
MKVYRPIFTAGPWRSDWGDPAQPHQVAGVGVARELLCREDGGAALVTLTDGRYALTGATFAAGTAQALKRHARSRSRRASEGERRWLLVVVEDLRARSKVRRLPLTGGGNRQGAVAATPGART